MMTGDDETHRLYRIMGTVMQMLKDRGYHIRDDELNMTKQQFISKYGENPKRDDLVMVKSKLASSDRIFVFFPKESKIGVSTIRDYTIKMKSEDVNRAIVVAQQKLTSFANNCLSQVASMFHIEVFLEPELLINIKEHVLVPEHQVLSDADKKNLLVRYTVKETQLPRMQVTDPVSRYYGLKRGQVVRIIRPSETAGRYITYRYCV